MRGRSYTPSPPRGYGRRGRSPPRGRHGRGGDAPTSLLVRNLRHDCRPEDLRRPFGQFGPIKDIYLPRDYYSGNPRGFGFVQYVDPADAAEAKYQMDGQIMQGRALTVVFAEENRKKPNEMRAREQGSDQDYHRRQSSPRYSHSPRYSRSPQRRHGRSHSREMYYSPPGRIYSRSVTPRDKKHNRERSYSGSPVQDYSIGNDGHRNRGGTPLPEPSPHGSRSQSPYHERVRRQSRSRSRSPFPSDYARDRRSK